jgi:hypothetical protein
LLKLKISGMPQPAVSIENSYRKNAPGSGAFFDSNIAEKGR